jgi:hypothetical protein
MSEPIYDENDTPLDKLRYRKYKKDQGEDCTESTEPTVVNVYLVEPSEKYFCLPKTFPTDLDAELPKDSMCKTESEWVELIKERIPGLTPVGLLYWTFFFRELRELSGYDSQQECEQSCQKRWFCNNNDEECELLDLYNEDGSLKTGPYYPSKEQCEDNCPTETPSPS